MKKTSSQIRNSHFLGTKIRNLRKRNNLTMEDLSSRCIHVDVDSAPSISYLSMIERGSRVPSEALIQNIAQVFQKPAEYFYDSADETPEVAPVKSTGGGLAGMALEPNFLFSKEILQIAIPELLVQSGVSGREFAHLLIRGYQEYQYNQFPDLERAAEELGQKRMPLSVDDLMDIVAQLRLNIEWFNEPIEQIEESDSHYSLLKRSFFVPPNSIHINQALKKQPKRLKYDIAVHIGHKVLHGGSGLSPVIRASRHAIGGSGNLSRKAVESHDILQAWRDFECSFFAGALLCPRIPFRRYLDQYSHQLDVAEAVGVTKGVAMRRMTAVTNYPYWHYFDAYFPSKLKAVYRGNGIPLPIGNMRTMQNPCDNWSILRLLENPDSKLGSKPVSQISVLETDSGPRIYSCESVTVRDLASNHHVLCAGVDVNPALDAQGMDSLGITQELKQLCIDSGGTATIPKSIQKELRTVAKILNIQWIEKGSEQPAHLICVNQKNCPRRPRCGCN